VSIIAAFQSRAQLLARWGEHNTATILNNCGAVMVFGGTRDRDDLIFWSTLAGDRDEPTLTTDMHGRVASRTTRRVPVLPAAQLANLPAGKVMLIRRGLAPVVGRVQMAWQRRDVRAHAFQVAHPELVARLRRWAGSGRRCGVWLGAPFVTVGAWISRIVRRLGHAITAACARAVRWALRGPDPTVVRGVPVDLDPPTGEGLVPVSVPAGAPHASTNGRGNGRGNDQSDKRSDDPGRPDVPFGDGWWN